MEPISETLREMLVRQGIDAGRPASRLATRRGQRAATRKSARIKARSAAEGSALPGSAGLEDRGPIHLAWVNPMAIGGRTAKMRRPMLVVVK
jgi:hypothetical protein